MFQLVEWHYVGAMQWANEKLAAQGFKAKRAFASTSSWWRAESAKANPGA
jgi:hypothetical protein